MENYLIEEIPAYIDDNFFRNIIEETENYVRGLRADEKFDVANEFSRVCSVLQQIQHQLKEEQEKNKVLLENQVDASNRVEEALRISQNDRNVIEQLKKEILNAWSHADSSKVRENHTFESLSVLKEKYNELSYRLSKYTARSYEETNEFGEKVKNTLTKEIDRMHIENEELHKRLYVQRAYSEELQQRLEKALEKNEEIFREWDVATNDALSNKKKIETLSKKIEGLHEEQEKLSENLVHYKETADIRYAKLNVRETQIKELKKQIEDIKSENAQVMSIKAKLAQSLESYKCEIEKYKLETDQIENYMRLKESENKKLILEYEREMKKGEMLTRKMMSMEKTVNQQEQTIALQRAEMLTVRKEKDLISKSCDVMKVEVNKMKSSIEAQIKQIERSNGVVLNLKNENERLKQELSQVKNDLKLSIIQEKKSSMDQRHLRFNFDLVDAERLHLIEAVNQLNNEIEEKVKKIVEQESEIEAAKLKNEKIKEQFLDAIKNYKKAESKYQICHQKESDVKYRMKVFKNQIMTADHRLAAKVEEQIKLMKRIAALEKKITEVQNAHGKTKVKLEECQQQVQELKIENESLTAKLRENDAKFLNMSNQTTKLMRERDLIASQMYRRADESAAHENENITLKMAIERGSMTYNERLEDIKILKNEISNLRDQRDVLKRGLEKASNMRHEVLSLHRKLYQEKLKVKALSEEMRTPLNVHRWRKLKFMDPSRMELIKKCQRLQRKSLRQFYEIAKADEIIKSLREKISEQQKEIDRRACAGLQRKLLTARTKLEMNEKRMKSAVAISRASETDLALKDHTITQFQATINELKSQLYKEKRARQKLADKLRTVAKNSGDYGGFAEKERDFFHFADAIKMKMSEYKT